MNKSSRKGFWVASALCSSALVMSATLAGCGWSENNTTNAAHSHAGHDHAGHDHAGHDHGDHSHAEHSHAEHSHTGNSHTGNSHDHGHDSADAHTHRERADLGVHTHNTWLEFISPPKQLKAGELGIWLLNIWQKGKPATKARNRVPDFALVHDKLMHLIVVSKDLSYFNHVHPHHKGNGHFIIEQTLPHGGTYKIYADYTPLNGQQEVAQHELSVEGAPAPRAALVADKWVNGAATKRVVSKPEEQPGAPGGDTYNVRLTLPAKVEKGRGVELRFRVADAANKPVADLEPYLGAMGHAVILSSDTNIYLHTHPEDELSAQSAAKRNEDSGEETRRGGPEVVFHTVFPTTGLYKVWAQFQHKGRILTAPFVFNVVDGNKPGAKSNAKQVAAYTCPMHPEVSSGKPGRCSKCGMDLVQS